VVITEAILKITKISVSPAVTLSHALSLKCTTAKYPVHKIELKRVSIPKGNKEINLDDVWLGRIPSKIIIGFVTSKAMAGSYETNPFLFGTFILNFLGCYLNGKSVPSVPLQIKFNGTDKAGANYIEAYHTLFSGTGMLDHNMGVYIDRDDVPCGYFLAIFSIDPMANIPHI
jgi:hypothetical protein